MLEHIKDLLKGNIKTSEDWCMKLLKEERVAVIPGEAFEVPGFARLSFTTEFGKIKEGIKRIKHFIE